MTQPPGHPPRPGEPYDPYAQPNPPAPQPPPAWGAPPPTSGAGFPPNAPYPTSGGPTSGGPTSGGPTSGQPYPAPGYPGDATFSAAAPPPRRRRGLLITSIVLAVVVLLCGGGGTAAYFLVKSVEGRGQATPEQAVDGFLTAVFKDKDVDKATTYVCSAARDKSSLTRKINELKSYQQKYKSADFSWPSPTVDKQTKNSATLTVPVKFSTNDDRVAEKKLRFTAVNESGWWVCEVRDVS
jgi:flagellar basal body-associated protein FliL